jgi:hypothetical protein
MADIRGRIRSFFIGQRSPGTAFQLTSRYVSGALFSTKDKKLQSHFILPLEGGEILPSFDKKNITDPGRLAKKFQEGMRHLHVSGGAIACLLPDLCVKIFIFSFDSLPPSQIEREELVRWRIGKQMPVLPEDLRLAFTASRANGQEKVLASIARSSLIREYEDAFAPLGLKVRYASAASLGLLPLLSPAEGKDKVIVNIEADSLALLAVANGEIVLFRVKPFLAERGAAGSESLKMESIGKEIENTVHFIEDKEKRRIESLWVRLALLGREDDLWTELKESIHLPLYPIESLIKFPPNAREGRMLAPLIGPFL